MFSGNDFGLNYLYANFGKSRGTIVGAVNSIKRLPNNACFTRTATTLLVSALCILHVPEPHSFLDVVLFGVCPVSGGSCCRSASKLVTLSPLTLTMLVSSIGFQHINFLTTPRCHSDLLIPALVKECVKENLNTPQPRNRPALFFFLSSASLFCQASRCPCRLSALGGLCYRCNATESFLLM